MINENPPMSREEVYAWLTEANSGMLATVSADGEPHISTIFFVVDEDFNMYFSTKTGTRKYGDMQENNRVALAVTDERLLVTVQLRGTVTTLKEGENEKGSFVRLMAADNRGARWMPPISKIDAGEYVMMKITPTWLRYGDFSKGVNEKDCFVQIIP